MSFFKKILCIEPFKVRISFTQSVEVPLTDKEDAKFKDYAFLFFKQFDIRGLLKYISRLYKIKDSTQLIGTSIDLGRKNLSIILRNIEDKFVTDSRLDKKVERKAKLNSFLFLGGSSSWRGGMTREIRYSKSFRYSFGGKIGIP